MIQIKVMDSSKSIKNVKGTLISKGTKVLDRIGIINEQQFLEKQIASQLVKKFEEEGIIAEVKII